MKRCLLPLLWLAVLAIICLPGRSSAAEDVRREIAFPDLPGYVTLKCDLHMHTVFSDGQVWPTVRVMEAWRQGLDAISITDHLEVQPHADDVPTRHNRPYELAAPTAKAYGMLLIRGTEITRETPPGHFNAIFLDDVEPLDTPDLLDAISNAHKQGAFVFWNHHAWKGPERGQWSDFHTKLYDNGWLQGLEVCNGRTYYPQAHQWCLEKNLTMLGNSDIHEPDRREQSTADNHRTMTLVFAKERSVEAIHEALNQRRTVVWFEKQLIGPREWLEPLVAACIEVGPPNAVSGHRVWFPVRNHSDAEWQLRRAHGIAPTELVLPPRSTAVVRLQGLDPEKPVELRCEVTNALVAPDTPLTLTLRSEVAEPVGAE